MKRAAKNSIEPRLKKAKMEPSFQTGDYVFAQVKNWMPWPAQISEIMKTRCRVEFFQSEKYPMYVFLLGFIHLG